jgi:hypothetical protein
MKKKLNPVLLAMSILFFAVVSCSIDSTVTGSDNVVEEELNYSDFNAVDLSHSFSAEIIQSENYKLIISYNSNLREYVEVKKEGKLLKIGLADDHFYRNVKLSVKIYMPVLNKLAASGACKINIPKLSSDNCSIELSGASDLHAVLDIMNELKINSSGASEINLSGKAKNAEFSLSGASDLSGKDLIISDKLNIESSGASSVKISADGKIYLNLSGASSVDYYGNGSVVKSDLSGASEVRKREYDTIKSK